MPVELTDTCIDYKAEKYQTMLANLQGNILKGHGRDYSVHIFIRFTAEPHAIEPWMRDFAEQYVTSTRKQLDESESYKTKSVPGGLFGNFFLTSTGYEKILSFMKDNVAARFQERMGVSVTFRDGMEAGRSELNNPHPSTWDESYRGQRIHAMILLADDDQKRLQAEEQSVRNSLAGIADVLTIEHGAVLRNKDDRAIEHFGYVDGRSQPLFFKQDIDDEARVSDINRWEWDPAAPLELVLVPDPNIDEEDCFGSYLVFRKLEQNVKGFKTAEKALARMLGLTEGNRGRAGAMIVGRFRDGTPLTLSAEDRMDLAKGNNFTYAEDTEGMKCPFHAHIRKVNPRGDNESEGRVSLERERRHRIVRRGITYGQRKPNLEDEPENGVGLLFMCFQSNISAQFAFLQKAWVNNPNFARRETGRDPIIGQRDNSGIAEEQRWPVEWDKPEIRLSNFADFVTLKGGEFLFAPSIPFLKRCRSTLMAVQVAQTK